MPLYTEQDSETHIMGSGCVEAYPWYVHTGRAFNYEAPDHTAPDGWSYDLTMYAVEGGAKVVVVNHDRLIDTMRLVADGHVNSVGSDCVTQCEAFLTDPEDADFDADTADQVLQVLAYGQVVYA